jgi:hypothetical protein
MLQIEKMPHTVDSERDRGQYVTSFASDDAGASVVILQDM